MVEPIERAADALMGGLAECRAYKVDHVGEAMKAADEDRPVGQPVAVEAERKAEAVGKAER